jgi:hypothetical protein
MFAQAATITLRILGFRAGPQDFPYSVPLAQALPPLAILVTYLEYRFTLPPAVSLAQAVAAIAALAFFTYQLLRLRALTARFQQALNALLATGIVLTLLLLPAVAILAPYVKQIAADPDLIGKLQVPALPTLLAAFLSLWNLAVSAHIYRNALNIGPGLSVVTALMGAVFITAFAALAGGLVS